MNQNTLLDWQKRFEDVNVFEEFDQIQDMLRQEYLKSDQKPFVVSFSGGKDSSLVLTLLWKALLSISPEQREREVHVVLSGSDRRLPPQGM